MRRYSSLLPPASGCAVLATPEGGRDRGRLERAFHRQVQGLAVLLVVLEIELGQRGPALLLRFAAQVDLVLLPS
jgi:hypothetical protein